ncbi:MAG: metallophosphoesterase [Myxococcaceae bacterium]
MPAPPVAYITDVEGMWGRIESFARDNPHVELRAGELFVKPGAIFIFGGDAIDRGPHGRKVVRALVEVKRRQPDQVVLLAGNRDLNKLRLTRELRGHPPQKMPEEIRSRSSADQLRWIFSNTMGAGEAFEHRRTELQGANDDTVVESFLEDVSNGGAIREYLKSAQLAHRIGPTLFVHGGVTEENLFLVPTGERRSDVERWVHGLNQWYGDQLASVDGEKLDESGKPLWTQLMAYQAPLPGTRLNQTSVVYGRTADALNNPLLPNARVRERLRGDGIHRIVVGHTPNGDSPSILRAPDFEQIIADTSHAKVPEGPRLLIEERRSRSDGFTLLEGEGRERVSFDLELGDDSPIGKRLKANGALIKGALDSGDFVTFWYEPKFQAVNRRLRASELKRDELAVPDHPHG